MAKKSSATTSRRALLLRRFLLIAAAVLVVLGIFGAVAFHVFQGWRARDLAGKSLENLDQANYRAAWLQMNSARNLRSDDPVVLRAAAIIESRFGMPTAMDYWQRLAERTELSDEDLETRAQAAAALGSDEQFAQAVESLEGSGQTVAAGRLRTVRGLTLGNTDRAIDEARRVVATTDDPEMKLDLARLLFRRHVDRLAAAPQDEQSLRIANEMTALVDALQGTEKGEEALGFGLAFLRPGADKQEEWIKRVMKNARAESLALLPAATVMVELGKATPQELHGTLRPVFDAAPLERRAAFVSWLTRQGVPREALTLITAQEAGESTEAFLARTEALAAMGNWPAVIEAAEAGGKAPSSLRLVTKARAEYALRQQAQSGAKSLADALRAGARERTLAVIVATGDDMGGQETVDATLIELCGDPRAADEAFRLTRDRLSRRGPSARALLESAHARAMVAAPNAVAVQDFARYVKLLAPPAENEEGEEEAQTVDPEETARAVAAAPADPAVRMTHALALVKAGRGEESFALFDDITIYFNRLPPPLQAVLAGAAAASGQRGLAVEMRGKIDVSKLTPDERRIFEDSAGL